MLFKISPKDKCQKFVFVMRKLYFFPPENSFLIFGAKGVEGKAAKQAMNSRDREGIRRNLSVETDNGN